MVLRKEKRTLDRGRFISCSLLKLLLGLSCLASNFQLKLSLHVGIRAGQTYFILGKGRSKSFVNNFA